MKFRSKVQEVQAYQHQQIARNESGEYAVESLPEWLGKAIAEGSVTIIGKGKTIIVENTNGVERADIGDFIVQADDGFISTLPEPAFNSRYEAA